MIVKIRRPATIMLAVLFCLWNILKKIWFVKYWNTFHTSIILFEFIILRVEDFIYDMHMFEDMLLDTKFFKFFIRYWYQMNMVKDYFVKEISRNFSKYIYCKYYENDIFYDQMLHFLCYIIVFIVNRIQFDKYFLGISFSLQFLPKWNKITSMCQHKDLYYVFSSEEWETKGFGT